MTQDVGKQRPLTLSTFAHVLKSKGECHRALRDETLSSNPGGYWSTSANLLMMDDPRHATMRSEARNIIGRLDPLPSAVREEIAAVIDTLRDRSKIDLVNDFARRVSSVVVQALMGLHEPLTDELLETISRTAANLDIWTTGSIPENLSMFEAVRFFLRADSVKFGGLSLLREAALHQRITEEELLVTPVVLAHAAYENSTNLLAIAALRIVTETEERRRMAEPADGVREVGRIVNDVCPTRYVIRRATSDIRIQGRLVQAGERVAVPLDGPVELPFGTGRHACPGARLALAEAAFSLHMFAQVISGDWTPIEVEWKDHPIFHGLRSAVVAKI
jgi:cytochrome P450